jgi:hypothetical protein
MRRRRILSKPIILLRINTGEASGFTALARATGTNRRARKYHGLLTIIKKAVLNSGTLILSPRQGGN